MNSAMHPSLGGRAPGTESAYALARGRRVAPGPHGRGGTAAGRAPPVCAGGSGGPESRTRRTSRCEVLVVLVVSVVPLLRRQPVEQLAGLRVDRPEVTGLLQLAHGVGGRGRGGPGEARHPARQIVADRERLDLEDHAALPVLAVVAAVAQSPGHHHRLALLDRLADV